MNKFSRQSKTITEKYLNLKNQDSTLGLYLDSCIPLGKNSAKLVVGSSTEITLPTIKKFIFDVTNHKLIPYGGSFIPYKKENKIFRAGIIAYRSGRIEKCVEDNSHLIQVSGNTYLDMQVNEIWEKEDIDGTPFFIKTNTEDIDQILQDVSYITASTNVRNEANINNFIPIFSKNDWIEFFTLKDGKPGIAIGQINNIDKEVEVSIGDLRTKVPVHAITRVIKSSDQVNSIADVIKFLKKAYPKDYSKVIKKIKK